MPLFSYDDVVVVKPGVDARLRPGERGWVVGGFVDRPGKYFDMFPDGVVYTIEFADGSSQEIHEKDLESVTE